MNKNLKVFIPIVLFGLIGMIGFKYFQPMIEDYKTKESSDAGQIKNTIKIGVDSWVGYFPLCSKDFRKRMRGNGYLIKCVDDKANYQERYQNLKDGELDFAVGTVDSYVLNGKDYDYPGTIVTIIDESKGGMPSSPRNRPFEIFNDLKKAKSLKVAFTPDSPSEHLLNSTAVHFDVKSILSGNIEKYEADGAEQAYKALLDGETDIAVLWEPFVSKALENANYHAILSSKDTQKLIVDVLIVNRKFSDRNPETVNVFLRNYYRTLKYYRDNYQQLLSEVAAETKLKPAAVESMLQGVSWQTLHSNGTKWFGISQGGGTSKEYLVDSIESSIEIMRKRESFSFILFLTRILTSS